MGSAQKEATVVAIGLVIVATLVVVYLFNEGHRREVASEQKIEESTERGIAAYVSYCFECHGEEGKGGSGRQGIPLNTAQNQEEDTAIWEVREPELRLTIERGRGSIMPAWAQSEGGPLNEEQVTDLINLIHTGKWDDVREAVLEANHGEIPPPPPLPTPEGGPNADPQVAAGQTLYQANCAGCHSVDGSVGAGPSWENMYGSTVTLEGGETVTADDAYITESIHDPTAKIHQGFTPSMPPFTQLTDDDIAALIAYMKTISENAEE